MEKGVGEINLSSARTKIQINQAVSAHDYYGYHLLSTIAKVIAFPVIYSSVWILTRTNAERFETTTTAELHRVIIHEKYLRLCGINDKGPGERWGLWKLPRTRRGISFPITGHTKSRTTYKNYQA